jgi:hypothetical protein
MKGEINHIVLFKVEEGVTQQQIDEFYENLFKLKEKIPGIISIVGGNNISIENFDKGFTEGFVMKFRDKDSRDNYVNHEWHIKFIEEYVDPIFGDCIVFDFEVFRLI